MWSMFETELKKIDMELEAIKPRDIPRLLNNIPLSVFGKLLLDIPSQYSRIKAFFPSMASEEVQNNWTGTHGQALLNQSLAFIKTMVFGYAVVTGKKIENASKVLVMLHGRGAPAEDILGLADYLAADDFALVDQRYREEGLIRILDQRGKEFESRIR